MSSPHDDHPVSPPREGGFSIIEVLAVMAIIGMMAAVAVPNALAYMRNYQIQAAGQMVASELQSARTQAIKRNVNFGVVFVPVSQDMFRYVLEDVPGTFARTAIDTAVGMEGGAGPLLRLPSGVQFEVATGTTDRGVRFNRFGAMCDPGSNTTCPDLPGGFPVGGPFFVMDPAQGATIRVRQPSTNLTRAVTVTPGGRVQIQP